MFRNNFGDLANTSFDEQSAIPQQFDQSMAEEVIKYRTKVSDLLNHADSISPQELKACEDLSTYRDWFIKLIKNVNKLQSTVDQDFVQQFAQLSNSQNQLVQVMIRNEELETQNKKLKLQREHRDGGEYSSQPNQFGSYDDQDRSFSAEQSSNYNKHESQDNNRALIESLQQEKQQIHIMLAQQEEKAMENEREITRLNNEVHSANSQSRELQEQLSESRELIHKLQTSAGEQLAKYNKVKKALFSMKDKAKEENANADQSTKDLKVVQDEYEKLVAKHATLKKSHDEQVKLYKKKYEKTKQLVEKHKKEAKEKTEQIKEKDKQIAGFMKAQEAFDVQRRSMAEREKSLLDDRNVQEANIQAMLQKMEKLDRSQMDVSMDRSVMMDQMAGIQAVLDPDGQQVTLISNGTDGKAFKMKTKIRLVNPDASFLQDTSQLDVSKDASYMIGDIFAQEKSQPKPPQPAANIFGRNQNSASPSSSPTGPSNIPPTPVIGGRGEGQNFFTEENVAELGQNTSFTSVQPMQEDNQNTSLLGIGGNMFENQNQNNLDNSLLGLDGGNMMQQNPMQADTMNRSLLGLDGGMMQPQQDMNTSLMDLNGAMNNPAPEMNPNDLSAIDLPQDMGLINDGGGINTSIIDMPKIEGVPSEMQPLGNELQEGEFFNLQQHQENETPEETQGERMRRESNLNFDPNDFKLQKQNTLVGFEAEIEPIERRGSTFDPNGGNDLLLQVNQLQSDGEHSGRMSTSGPENGTESGAGTLVGENMQLNEDPFNGRRRDMFKEKQAGRKSVALDHLGGSGAGFRQLSDEDDESSNNFGSMVSGNFGGVGKKSIRTPGFNAGKKFSFSGNDPGESETIQMVQDSQGNDSDDDDISSMHSDFLQFRRQNGHRRSFSQNSGMSGMNSESSSEMEHISENAEDINAILRRESVLRRNQVDSFTQTDHIQIVRFCEVQENGAQTDVALEAQSSPSKAQVQAAIIEEKRKLEQEREESLTRLMQIEKRLNKTEQTSKLWDSDTETESETQMGGRKKRDIVTTNRLYSKNKLPRKKRSAIEQERLSQRNTSAAQEDDGCCQQNCRVQ